MATAKQIAFYEAYKQNGGNKRQAALAAGYNGNEGSHVFKSDGVQALIKNEAIMATMPAAWEFVSVEDELKRIDKAIKLAQNAPGNPGSSLSSLLGLRMKMLGLLDKDNKNTGEAVKIVQEGFEKKTTYDPNQPRCSECGRPV